MDLKPDDRLPPFKNSGKINHDRANLDIDRRVGKLFGVRITMNV